MKIVIAPDKFKGNLSSFEVCEALRKGIKMRNPGAEVLCFPMADGGDGFGTILEHYYGTAKTSVASVDPLGRAVNAFYQWNEEEKVAIIELAVASGIALLKKEEFNPLRATTYGTGILIKEAIRRGARKIILGIGGSASTDGGIGILQGIGFRFLDYERKELSPFGESLSAIQHIMPPAELPEITFLVATDVTNILYGASGAAFIYAGQKGANNSEIKLLDQGLRNFASILFRETGKDVSQVPGSGAAGGAAAGLMAYFDIKIERGVDLVIEASGLEASLEGADLLITGEGKIDMQSTQGKVVSRIASFAMTKGIDCVAVCGMSELNAMELEKIGIKKVLAIRDCVNGVQESMEDAKGLLEKYASLLLTNEGHD